MDENLQIVYNHCIFHLDSIHAQSISKLHFEHNGGRSWIYSRSFPCPLSFEILNQPITDSMLILQIVGEISSIETVPTAEREGQDEVGNDGVHVACWVEPRSDTASRTLWGRIRQSLDGVAEATDVKLNFSQLFAVDEVTGVPRLKVVWMPSQGQTTLPVFRQGYPCSLADVLDRKPVQVLFHLEHGPVVAEEEAYLHAALIYIASV